VFTIGRTATQSILGLVVIRQNRRPAMTRTNAAVTTKIGTRLGGTVVLCSPELASERDCFSGDGKSPLSDPSNWPTPGYGTPGESLPCGALPTRTVAEPRWIGYAGVRNVNVAVEPPPDPTFSPAYRIAGDGGTPRRAIH
jgi:hypothetical protein